MKLSELRKKTENELLAEFQSAKKELFALRMQRSMQQSVKTHLFRKVRRNAARVMTILGEKERERGAA